MDHPINLPSKELYALHKSYLCSQPSITYYENYEHEKNLGLLCSPSMPYSL